MQPTTAQSGGGGGGGGGRGGQHATPLDKGKAVMQQHVVNFFDCKANVVVSRPYVYCTLGCREGPACLCNCITLEATCRKTACSWRSSSTSNSLSSISVLGSIFWLLTNRVGRAKAAMTLVSMPSSPFEISTYGHSMQLCKFSNVQWSGMWYVRVFSYRHCCWDRNMNACLAAYC